MYDCTADYVRLPISSVKNVRELGGYPTKDGGMTQWHRVLRAGDMTELSEADRSFLLGYGLTTVIDLRSADETAARPNPLAEDSRIEYYQLPYIAGDLTAIDAAKAVRADGGDGKEISQGCLSDHRPGQGDGAVSLHSGEGSHRRNGSFASSVCRCLHGRCHFQLSGIADIFCIGSHDFDANAGGGILLLVCI